MENISAMATVRFLPMFTFSTSGVCLAEMTFGCNMERDTYGYGMEAWDHMETTS